MKFHNLKKRTTKTIGTVIFNGNKVLKYLNKIKETKSPGYDSLHTKVIKETASQISKPLTALFNQSMKNSIVPKKWKLANVMLIHNSGSKQLVSNYRPISLTSIIGKIIETEIRDTIMKHMESNDLFTKHQHGFRSDRSCQTQRLEVLEEKLRHRLKSAKMDGEFAKKQTTKSSS